MSQVEWEAIQKHQEEKCLTQSHNDLAEEEGL